ncbi:hypothetical protein NHX12_009519 [Muraenolepis orangiensis]|uniref:Heart- and neural crest derivatives-expressed protein 1 n=1 Tax=Muraenolepis orangiensis TaxID=630683 RepID=A0A9Q0DKG3_9TELE|nr:hypothetical protein NHX12_009519 [Muraenolepis orangiensis]
MNVVRSYQHHHLMHEGFPFAPRCPQEPYLHGWGPQAYPAEALYGAPPGGLDAPLEGLSARSGTRRAPGPKKERRRTESINTAFAELRERIPNVPADTKLSKIKTLRLATSYISYLMDVLAADCGPADGFKADIKKFDHRETKRKRELSDGPQDSGVSGEKKVRGRTGWPQQVWALELNP